MNTRYSEVSVQQASPSNEQPATETISTPWNGHPLVFQRIVANQRTASPAALLSLQRRYGNRAVSQLLAKTREPQPFVASMPSRNSIGQKPHGVIASGDE